MFANYIQRNNFLYESYHHIMLPVSLISLLELRTFMNSNLCFIYSHLVHHIMNLPRLEQRMYTQICCTTAWSLDKWQILNDSAITQLKKVLLHKSPYPLIFACSYLTSLHINSLTKTILYLNQLHCKLTSLHLIPTYKISFISRNST